MTKREQIVSKIIDAGEKLAMNYGFTLKNVMEETSKGIWGPEFVKELEKKHGKCSTHIYWYDPKNNQQYIEFRFKFADPTIAINLVGPIGEQILASVTVSNWNHITQEHDGIWQLSEVQIFSDFGFEYAEKLRSIVNEICEEVEKGE